MIWESFVLTITLTFLSREPLEDLWEYGWWEVRGKLIHLNLDGFYNIWPCTSLSLELYCKPSLRALHLWWVRRLEWEEERGKWGGEGKRRYFLRISELWPTENLSVLEEKSSSHAVLGIIFTKEWMRFVAVCWLQKPQCCCHLKPIVFSDSHSPVSGNENLQQI